MSVQRLVLACQETTQSKHHHTHAIYSLLCRARRSCLYRDWFLPAKKQHSLNIITLIQYTACYVAPEGHVCTETGSCLPRHRETFTHICPTIARYSFIQLRELGPHLYNFNLQVSKIETIFSADMCSKGGLGKTR